MEFTNGIPNLEAFIDKTIQKCLLEYDLGTNDTETVLDDMERAWPNDENGRSSALETNQNEERKVMGERLSGSETFGEDGTLMIQSNRAMERNINSTNGEDLSIKLTNGDRLSSKGEELAVGRTNGELRLANLGQEKDLSDSGSPDVGHVSSPTPRHPKLKSRLQQRYFQGNKDSSLDPIHATEHTVAVIHKPDPALSSNLDLLASVADIHVDASSRTDVPQSTTLSTRTPQKARRFKIIAPGRSRDATSLCSKPAREEARRYSSPTSHSPPHTTSQLPPPTTSHSPPHTTSHSPPHTTSQRTLPTTSQLPPHTTSQLQPPTTSQLQPHTTSQLPPPTTSYSPPYTTSQLQHPTTSHSPPHTTSQLPPPTTTQLPPPTTTQLTTHLPTTTQPPTITHLPLNLSHNFKPLHLPHQTPPTTHNPSFFPKPQTNSLTPKENQTPATHMPQKHLHTHPHRHTPNAKPPHPHHKPHNNNISPQQITAPTNRTLSPPPTERHPPTSIPHPATVPQNLRTCHSKSAEHRQNLSSVDNYHSYHHYHEHANNIPDLGRSRGSTHPPHHHHESPSNFPDPPCHHGSIIACIIAEELQKDNIPINNRRSGQPTYSGNMINARNRNRVSPKEADNLPCDLSYSNSTKQPFCQSRTETQHSLTRFDESVVRTRYGFVPVSASSSLEASKYNLDNTTGASPPLGASIKASSPLGASRYTSDTTTKTSSPLGASRYTSDTTTKTSSPLGASRYNLDPTTKASSPLGASIKASPPLGESRYTSDTTIGASSPLGASRHKLDTAIKASSPLGASINGSPPLGESRYNLDPTTKGSFPLVASRYALDTTTKESSPLDHATKAAFPLGASRYALDTTTKESSPLDHATKAAFPLGASRYTLDTTTIEASHLDTNKPSSISWNAEIPVCPSLDDEQPECLSRKPERKQFDTTKEIVRSESDVKFSVGNTIFRDRFNNSSSHLSSAVTSRHLDTVTSRVTSSPSNTSDGCCGDYNSGSEDKNKRPMKSEIWKTRGQVHVLEGHNEDSEVVTKRRKR